MRKKLSAALIFMGLLFVVSSAFASPGPTPPPSPWPIPGGPDTSGPIDPMPPPIPPPDSY